MNGKLAILLTSLVITALISCSRTATSSIEGVSWIKYSGNPLGMGIELQHFMCPWVIYDGLTFKMWYQGENSDDIDRIYYATSPDGVDWTTYGMVLEGQAGSWDEKGVSTPVVLFDGTTYKMWYCGVGESTSVYGMVGLATSLDGIHWVKYPNPVLAPGGNGGWDDWNIGAISVIFNGTDYMMWYGAQAFRDDPVEVGAATSVNGIHWTKYSKNPVLAQGSGWDSDWVLPGSVIMNGSCYVMWYSGSVPGKWCIGVATSPDGFSWSKYDENPVLEPGPAGSWDSKCVSYGCIVKKGSTLLMFYQGYSNSNKIGLAISTLPVEEARIDIDPGTLNLKSKGKWVTAYIELPEGYYMNDINASSILLNDTLSVDPCAPATIGDYDNDSIPDLMVKFNRTEVISYVHDIQGISHGNVALTISGKLFDDTSFEGSDTIRIILPGDVNEDNSVNILDLAIIARALGTNPSHPYGKGWGQWNPNADVNEDSKVDAYDLATATMNYGATIP